VKETESKGSESAKAGIPTYKLTICAKHTGEYRGQSNSHHDKRFSQAGILTYPKCTIMRINRRVPNGTAAD
jgi:hypothetical protein